MLANDRAGRHRRGLKRDIVEGLHGGKQAPKTVNLFWKGGGDLALKDGKVVGEAERRLAPRPEGHARLFLLAECELVAVDAQLPEQFRQRGALHSRPHEVGHGVQADIEFPPGDAVEAVQPTDGIVALEEAHAAAEMRESNAGGET